MNFGPEDINWKEPLGAELARAGLADIFKPMQGVINRVAKSLAKQQDDKIREAISNHLGHEDWTPEEVAPRLTREIDQANRLETIMMDGEPIIRLGNIVMDTDEEGVSTFLRTKRCYQIMNTPDGTSEP